MNNLLNPASSVHPVQRKKLVEIKEMKKRDRKAQSYLDGVVHKLCDYHEPEYLPKKLIK